MSDVPHYTVIRGQFDCPWCDKAIAYLKDRGLSFDVQKLPMGELILRQAEVSHETVPLVFEGVTFIGGYDDLTRHVN